MAHDQIGICSVWCGRIFFWVGSGWVNSSHGAPFWCLFGAFFKTTSGWENLGKAMAGGSYPLREALLESCGFPKDTELTRLHLHPGAKEMGMALAQVQCR